MTHISSFGILCALSLAGACSANTNAGTTAGSGGSGSNGANAGSGEAASGSPSSGASTGTSSGTAPSSGSTTGAPSSGDASGSPQGSGEAPSGSPSSGSSGATSDASASGSGDGAAGAPRGPSAGCGNLPSGGDNPNGFTKHDITVTGVDAAFLPGGKSYGTQGGYDFTHRNYFLKLPTNYQANKAYPVVLGGGGCGSTNGLSGSGGGVDIFGGAQSAAIQIGLSYVYPSGAGACFADDFPDTPDLPYFDTLIAQVEASYCVDRGKIFVAGYSSGAWEAIMLGCARGGIVRGIGTQAGGLRINGPACNDMPVSPMMIAGLGDGENPIGPLTTPKNDSYGSAPARDEFLKQNGCTGTATVPYTGMSADSACVSYTGCPANAPVIWCAINGDHGSLGSTAGYWPFWSSLPAD